MASDTWKKHERAIAKRLNGKRVGPQGKEGNDIAHSLFGIECKERRRPLAKDITDALDQARDASAPAQLPIVVWHVVDQRHDSDVVMMRLKHFEAWAGTISGKEEGEE